jgi:hypothetical protein
MPPPPKFELPMPCEEYMFPPPPTTWCFAEGAEVTGVTDTDPVVSYLMVAPPIMCAWLYQSARC